MGFTDETKCPRISDPVFYAVLTHYKNIDLFF